MSAGNHAQGVACFSRDLGIPATIVMPSTTPFTKVRKVRAYGVTVVLEGEDFAAASAGAERLAQEEGLTLIHPYVDREVIAGQGTVALEMIKQAPEIQCLVVPDAGRPLQVISVQSASYPGMINVLGGLPGPKGQPTVVEGIAAQNPGILTRALVEKLVERVLVVSGRRSRQRSHYWRPPV